HREHHVAPTQSSSVSRAAKITRCRAAEAGRVAMAQQLWNRIENVLSGGIRLPTGTPPRVGYRPSMATHSGPLATIRCEPRQAWKGAAAAADSSAGVWLVWVATLCWRGVRAVEGARL